MSDSDKSNPTAATLPSPSRRNFLAGTVASAAILGAAGCSVAGSAKPSTGKAYCGNRPVDFNAPFQSFREYVTSIEQQGLAIRFPRLDQDKYEMTAVMYRLIEEWGWEEAPALIVDEVKIDGKWVKGPVVANHHGHLDTEAITFGVEPVAGDSRASYRKAMEYLQTKLVKGNFPKIDPVTISKDKALCKEVIVSGDDVDITRYAFIQSNPADGGRYLNTGSTFTSDPEMGMNYGTYRCQIHGPKLISINPEPNQTSWKHLMAAKERGEKYAYVSIAVGQDPYVWTVSGSRVVNRVMSKGPVNELAVAGGLKGSPIEVVKSETNDHLVPAHCEMIVEGRVPLDQMGPPEGPFGEMMGYMGPQKPENFMMEILTITHRRDPWILNQFTGVTRGYPTAPTAVLYNTAFKRLVPGLIEIHSPLHAPGITYVRIDKTKAGQGLRAGKMLGKIVPIYKLIVVVDKDIDILDQAQVDNAIATRLMPSHATAVVDGRGMPLDPTLSHIEGYSSGKIVLDATRQLPEEGGPDEFALRNRDWLDQLAPDAIANVDAQFGDILQRPNKPSC